MKYLRRIAETLLLLVMMNLVGIGASLQIGLPLRIVFSLSLALLFALAEILPCYERDFPVRLQILAGGQELMLTSLWAFVVELIFYVIRLSSPHSAILWWNLITVLLFLFLHFLNGFWRTVFCSSQLSLTLRIAMFFCWWIPVVHLFLFYRWYATVRRELLFERNKYDLDRTRAESAVCQTRYPVVMVHGIFFRDWQYLNYWGRIPQALKRNGAVVYYGKQQSSRAVADSAAELKEEILRVLRETGAEKVNIVAHSKGGLDSRYAIRRLGLAPYVASLTTINTPHRGCPFADALLGALPKGFVHFVEKRYNALFHKLGDPAPDFLAGVRDLTVAGCAVLNTSTPDAPGVCYQSVMTRLDSPLDADFPLNLTWFLVHHYGGANDGLVAVDSAPWGRYLGLLTSHGKGISHGDMIDLTRRNLKDFNVGEFYVQLFAKLKEQGF